MPNGNFFPHRRSIRLKGYDYRSNGAYFITLCTENRRHLFGSILNAELVPTPAGKIAEDRWFALPDHHPGLVLDAFVVMPDHIHAIIVLDRPAPPEPTKKAHPFLEQQPDRVIVANAASPTRPNGAPSGSLGAIVGSYRSSVTRHINALHGTPGASVWQRDYWEHIIRDDRALFYIRRYIKNNPANWRKGTLKL